jgi:glucose/mannose-6-phosphate isomerase
VDLDDPSRYGACDTADALADVEATAAQWRQAAEAATRPFDLDEVDTIVVSGMGGSGVAGDVLWALSLLDYPLPIVVHKGYGLPAFVGPHTLVISFSHSGSTEETLSGFAEAGRRGALRLAVTGGGPLGEQATAAGVPVAAVPSGTRPPRHSLGALLVPALVAVGLDAGLDEAVDVLEDIAASQGRSVPTADNPAKQVASRIAGEGLIPLAWGGMGIGAVAAYRLKCQLNENAKLPALYAELPEADHNDVVGWEQPSVLRGTTALIELRDPAGEHPRITRRFEITAELVAESVALHAVIQAIGSSPLARMASLLLQADLLTVYTALAADRDPTPIASIDRLKSALDDQVRVP